MNVASMKNMKKGVLSSCNMLIEICSRNLCEWDIFFSMCSLCDHKRLMFCCRSYWPQKLVWANGWWRSPAHSSHRMSTWRREDYPWCSSIVQLRVWQLMKLKIPMLECLCQLQRSTQRSCSVVDHMITQVSISYWLMEIPTSSGHRTTTWKREDYPWCSFIVPLRACDNWWSLRFPCSSVCANFKDPTWHDRSRGWSSRKAHYEIK